LDAKLKTTTPVPDPQRILPYRNALLAQDYTIVAITKGYKKELKVGGNLRVYRYGVLNGEKTSLKDLKPGAVAHMTVQLLELDPKLKREYQLNDLDTVFTSDFVEVAAKPESN